LSNRASADREQAIAGVLDELTVWTPRERQGAFRSWLRGSLSLVHLHVLTILEDGPLPMSRLADALDVSVASATGIIDRMEGRKLVERLSDPADRRRVLVHATRPGVDVFEALTRERRAKLAPLLERMTDDELASFLTGLRALRRIRAEIHDSAAGQ